jgi:hypothetical protein
MVASHGEEVRWFLACQVTLRIPMEQVMSAASAHRRAANETLREATKRSTALARRRSVSRKRNTAPVGDDGGADGPTDVPGRLH